MTRRFLDELRADKATITAAFTDLLVTGGETPAPALAALLETNNAIDIDIIDSTVNDECAIASNSPSLAVPTAIAWQPLTTGIYDVEVGGDLDFLIVDTVNGSVTTSATAGFTYGLEGKISFTDLGSNTPIDFSILANGVQVGFIAALTGGGGNRPRTVAFSHVQLSAAANTVYTIGIQTTDGVNSIDIGSIGLSVTIKPTNNP